MEIKRIFVGGLAIEYCIKETVLDAVNLGFYWIKKNGGFALVKFGYLGFNLFLKIKINSNNQFQN